MKISINHRGFPPDVVEYAAGVPLDEIGLRYGVTPKTVRKRARLMGIAPRKVKVTGARLARVIALYRRGLAWNEICEAMEIDRKTLSVVLKRKGVRLRMRMRS